MKVCFLTRSQNPKLGGLDRYSFEIAGRLAQKPGIKLEVLTEQASQQAGESVILKSIAGRPWLIFFNILSARKAIRQADIVHAMDLFPYGLVAAVASLGLNKRIFINGVGTESVVRLDRPFIGWFLRWAYKRAEKVLCISKYTKNRILEKAPGLANLEVVYLGVDTKKFKAGSAHRDFFPTVLSVGAIKRRKGYHISLLAISRLIKKYPRFKYYIVGSQSISKFVAKIKQLVLERGLQDNVVFLENINDEQLLNLYYRSDIFLLPSINIGEHFEGFGLVFLEAAACGLPSVGTKDCGIEEAVRDGQTGLLVEQNSVELTAAVLDKLLSDPALRQSMGQQATNFAKNLDWNVTVDHYLRLYAANK